MLSLNQGQLNYFLNSWLIGNPNSGPQPQQEYFRKPVSRSNNYCRVYFTDLLGGLEKKKKGKEMYDVINLNNQSYKQEKFNTWTWEGTAEKYSGRIAKEKEESKFSLFLGPLALWENVTPQWIMVNTWDKLIIKYIIITRCCEGLSEMTPGSTVNATAARE